MMMPIPRKSSAVMMSWDSPWSSLVSEGISRPNCSGPDCVDPKTQSQRARGLLGARNSLSATVCWRRARILRAQASQQKTSTGVRPTCIPSFAPGPAPGPASGSARHFPWGSAGQLRGHLVDGQLEEDLMIDPFGRRTTRTNFDFEW